MAPSRFLSPTTESTETCHLKNTILSLPFKHPGVPSPSQHCRPPSLPVPTNPAVMIGYQHFPPTKPLGCVIIADNWAGWLPVTNSLSITCHELFITHISCPWLTRFIGQHQFPISFLTRQALSQSILHHQHNLLILLQGNDSILSLLPHTWFTSHHILWAKNASSASSPMRGWHHIALQASSYEGVMEGTYSFFSNTPFLPPPPSGPLHRRLRHVINPATRGVRIHPVPAPTDHDKLYNGTQWLPDKFHSLNILHGGEVYPPRTP